MIEEEYLARKYSKTNPQARQGLAQLFYRLPQKARQSATHFCSTAEQIQKRDWNPNPNAK